VEIKKKYENLWDSTRGQADLGSASASAYVTATMMEKVRKIFENIMEKLPVKCAEIFSEVFVEIFDVGLEFLRTCSSSRYKKGI
jgi:hypothetical protein